MSVHAISPTRVAFVPAEVMFQRGLSAHSSNVTDIFQGCSMRWIVLSLAIAVAGCSKSQEATPPTKSGQQESANPAEARTLHILVGADEGMGSSQEAAELFVDNMVKALPGCSVRGRVSRGETHSIVFSFALRVPSTVSSSEVIETIRSFQFVNDAHFLPLTGQE